MVASADRVRVIWEGTGTTSPIALGAAISAKFFAPPAALNGVNVSYLIEHQGEGIDQIELGRGVYTHSGATLARTEIVASTNGGIGGSIESFSAGIKHVSLTVLASDLAADGGHIIQQNGSALTSRPALNFSTGLTASDDAGNLRTNVVLAAHGHDLADITDAGDLAALDTVTGQEIEFGEVRGDKIYTTVLTAPAPTAGVSAITLGTDHGLVTVDDVLTTIARIADPEAARDVMVRNITGAAIEIENAAAATVVAAVPDKCIALLSWSGSAWTHKATVLGEDAIASGEGGGAWPLTEVTAATHLPAGFNRYYYTTAGGVIVVLTNAIEDGLDQPADTPSMAQLIKGTGAGDIGLVPANGLSINGSDQAGSDTSVADAVFTGASGATVTVTSAGSGLPDFAVGDLVRVTNHSNAANNGVYLVPTGGAHATNDLDLQKIDGGSNPANAGSEAVDFALLTPLQLVSDGVVERIGTDFVITDGTSAPKHFDGSPLEGIAGIALMGPLVLSTGGSISDEGPVSATGALTKALHGGRCVQTTGNVTIPNAAGDVGMGGVIRLGGAHTITFNSTVTATLAAGDVFTYYVASTTALARSLQTAATMPAMS